VKVRYGFGRIPKQTTSVKQGLRLTGWGLVFAITGLLLSGWSWANDVVLAVTDDTFTAPSDPDGNNGSGNYVRVREANNKVGFLNFDTYQLNGSAIAAANLNIYVRLVSSPGSLDVFPILGPWDEATVTYNSEPPIGASPIASVPLNAAAEGGYVHLNVAGLVQQWVGSASPVYGIALRGNGGLDAQFGVRERARGAFIDVTQGASTGNIAPTFTSTPPTLAAISTLYSYDADATDPNPSDILTYSLDQAPLTMTVNSASGLINWTPQSGDEGFHPVTVRVQDNGLPSRSQTQSFDIFVNPPGNISPNLLYFTTLGNTSVPGVPGPYDDADIYRFDLTTGKFDRVFDARNAKLPGSADINALYVVDPVTFYMSFSRNSGTPVPDLGVAMDEDIVIYHAGKFSWLLHGSDIGLGNDGNGEDIDAMHMLSPNSLLISTQGAAKVPGVAGAKAQDILRCDGTFGPTSSCTWSMYFDGSKVGLSSSSENINAFYVFNGNPNFSTRGPFSVEGGSGNEFDVTKCVKSSNSDPIECASFANVFDGNQFGISDDIDGAHFAANAFADPDPAKFRVAVLGSSTASGSGATSYGNSWVGLLDAWLSTVTTRHEIINMSKSGYTTEIYRPDGSIPVPDPNRNITRMLELNLDLIIINLPSNNVATNIPLATTIAHYAQIKAAADAIGVPLFIMTTQPRNFDNLSQRLQLQDEAIAIQSTFGAAVIDTYNELTDFGNNLAIKPVYDSGDGTHPSNAGHNYIFQQTRNLVAPVVVP